MLKKTTSFLFTLATAILITISAPSMVSTAQVTTTDNTIEMIDTIPPVTQEHPSQKDSLHDALVHEVDRHITNSFPKSKLSGAAVVDACTKHDFDICFALAQAEIESGLGTAGKGKRTNNPWNVGAYDGRTVHDMKKRGFGYTHPDHSIEPYILLVKTKYLGTRRTIHDLMKNYVTLGGRHRYAGDPGYERSLKSTYRRICTKTTIKELQEMLRQLG